MTLNVAFWEVIIVKKPDNVPPRRATSHIIRSVRFAFGLQWTHEKALIFLQILAQMLAAASALVTVLFPKLLLDSLTEKRFTDSAIIIAVFACWGLLIELANAAIARSSGVRGERHNARLNQMLFDKITTLRHDLLESPRTLENYEIARKCLQEGSITAYITGLSAVISDLVVLVGVVYILRGLPWWILLLFVVVTAVNAAVNIVTAKHSVYQAQEETPTERRMYYTRGRLMRQEYAKEIRVFNLLPFISAKYLGYVDAYFKISKSYDKKSVKALRWATIVGSAQSFVFYAYNIVQFARAAWTVGVFSMSMSAMLQFSATTSDFVSQIVTMGKQAIFLDKFHSFLEMSSSHSGTQKVATTSDFTITFEDVSFQYPDAEELALRNVNATIRSGEKLSIVGLNGAGKSTFVALLLGLYKPTSGKILLNGDDIEDLDYGEYSKMFAAVMQDYQVYAFTVMDNITQSAQPSAQENADARDAIDKIGLGAVIGALPQKEDTYLTQRFDSLGVELSGGEEQKLAIARALAKPGAGALILDEPTAALDPLAEFEINHLTQVIRKGQFSVFISHRLSTTRFADLVLVFDGGALVEQGNHAELMAQDGLYHRMFDMQSSYYRSVMETVSQDVV